MLPLLLKGAPACVDRTKTKDMFSYLSPEERVRQDHPLRAIRRMTDRVLRELSPRFTRITAVQITARTRNLDGLSH